MSKISRIDEQETGQALTFFQDLMSTPHFERDYPTVVVAKMQEAITSGKWELLADDFLNSKFIGSNGDFVFVAPYTVRRKGSVVRKLSGVRGKLIDSREPPPLGNVVQKIFGVPLKEMSPILAFEFGGGFGLTDQEDGEAFIVPDGWGLQGSENGPALNNMTEQRRRLKASGFRCIRKIFDRDSAALLIQSLESTQLGTQVQMREFLFHEAGHGAGIGLREKLSLNLLSTPWYRAVEEWRADGIEFALLRESLSPEDAGRVVAANLVLRLGVDSHRAGGMDRDTDVNAALLTFDRLLESGFLRITKRKQLEFKDISYSALLNAVEPHSLEAIKLTRNELSLQHKEGIWGLYGSVPVSSAAKALFNGFVTTPCSGAYKQLQ